MFKKLFAVLPVLSFLMETSFAGDEQQSRASETCLIVYLAGNKIEKGESIPCIIEVSNNTDDSIRIKQPFSFMQSVQNSKTGYFENGKKTDEKVWTISLQTNNSPRLVVKNDKLEAIPLDFTVDAHTIRYLKVKINRQDLGEGENTLRAVLRFGGEVVAISPEKGPAIDAK